MGLLKRLFGRSKPSAPFPTDENVQEESGAGTQAHRPMRRRRNIRRKSAFRWAISREWGTGSSRRIPLRF